MSRDSSRISLQKLLGRSEYKIYALMIPCSAHLKLQHDQRRLVLFTKEYKDCNYCMEVDAKHYINFDLS